MNANEPSDAQVLEEIRKELEPATPPEPTPVPPQNPPIPQTVDFTPLQAQINALSEELKRTSSSRQLQPDDIKAAVTGVVKGLADDKLDYDPDQGANIGAIKKLESAIEKRLQDTAGMSAQKIAALEQGYQQLQEVIVKTQFENAMDKLEKQYPNMNKKEVMGSFIAINNFNPGQANLEELAKQSHEDRSPDKFDVSKLSKEQKAKVFKNMMDEKKAEISKSISPQAGGPVPKIDDALLNELINSTAPDAWDALDELHTSGHVASTRLESIRKFDAEKIKKREARMPHRK
jgi:hypothetical protein